MISRTTIHTLPTQVAKTFDREAAALIRLGVSVEKINAFRVKVLEYMLNHTVEQTETWMKLEASFNIMNSSNLCC